MGRLDGVRVLDLSRLLPGPACTAWLAGQGASVDRVEPPGRGDFARHLPPYVDGVGAYFAATNLGKRSLAVDLRRPGAGALIVELARSYDVLVEGFKPGVLEAMGCGPDVLLAANPRLVVVRLSGYGQTGPLADAPGHDVNYVGLSGGLALTATRPGRGPVVSAIQIADLAGALVAAAGVGAALFDRERTGRGSVLDVSLAEAALWMAGPLVTGAADPGAAFGPGEHPLAGGLPTYGTFRCGDGRYVTVGALEAKFQEALLAGTESSLDPDGLAAWFAARSRDEAVAALPEACVGPALDPREVADHPQHAARGAVARLGAGTFVVPPLGVLPTSGALPAIGEHSDAVLADAGIDAARIAALRAAGVVA